MTAGAPAMLQTLGLVYAYPGEEEEKTCALCGIDLSIGHGEYVAVMGPNGSGKTTLLLHFNALLLPVQGEVLVNGLSTAGEANRQRIRRECGIIFQNPDNQLVATTVEEDVAFGLENYALPAAEIRERVAEALDLLGLQPLAQRPPHQLSGGQKQKVAIAGVLAMRPRCLLLDEPTAMLDPAGRQEVLHAVEQLRQKLDIAVVHVTHSPEEAARADRVLLLEQGKLAAAGTPPEILADIPRLHTLGLQGTTAAELAELLREKRLKIPPRLLHSGELVEALCSSAPKI